MIKLWSSGEFQCGVSGGEQSRCCIVEEHRYILPRCCIVEYFTSYYQYLFYSSIFSNRTAWIPNLTTPRSGYRRISRQRSLRIGKDTKQEEENYLMMICTSAKSTALQFPRNGITLTWKSCKNIIKWVDKTWVLAWIQWNLAVRSWLVVASQRNPWWDEAT